MTLREGQGIFAKMRGEKNLRNQNEQNALALVGWKCAHACVE
jgi:hypothetical protein